MGPRILVNIEARTTALEKAMDRAKARTDGAFRDMQGSARRFNEAMDRTRGPRFREAEADVSRLSASLSGATALAGRLGAVLGVGIGLNEIRQAADSYTRVTNALKVAGLEGETLTKTYGELFAAAQRQGLPLEETARLYGAITSAQKELKVESSSIMRFTEGVGVALKVAGSNATQASGALLQLGQAIGSGTVQAEEFNSILEGARPILVAVANGMREAGGSVATLRTMVSEGEVSSRAFFEAFLRGLPLLEGQARTTGDTSAQAFARIGNSLINLVGELDRGTGASGAFAAGANKVADGINYVAARIPAAVEALKGYAAALRAAIAGEASLGPAIEARRLSLEQTQATQLQARLRDPGLLPHQRRGLEEQLRATEARMALMQRAPQPDAAARAEFDREARRAGALSTLPDPTKGKPKIDPINAADFPVAGKDKGGGRSGGGSQQNAYERELEALNKRTAALRNEADMIGLTGRAAAEAEATFRLMQAAKEAGIPVSDATRAAMQREAAGYAEAKARVDELKESQRQSQALTQFLGTSLTSAASDLAAGGETAARAWERVRKSLVDAALQAALLGQGPLAGLFGIAAPQGQVGGLFGLLGNAIRGAGGAGGLLGGTIIPGILHSGGIAGRDGMGHARAVPAALFSGAPRFHSGLTSREFPAILEYGERVLTAQMDRRASDTIAGLAGQLASHGTGPALAVRPTVNVNVENYSGADVETRQGPDGSVDVVIKGMAGAMAGQAIRGRGPLKAALASPAYRAG